MSKRNLLFALQVVFYVSIVWFIIRRFDSLTATIDFGVLWSKPFYVMLSIVCFLGFYGLLARHWQLICRKYDKFPQSQQWLSFFASQPYKYLPSSVFTFSSRAVYAKKLGLPIKQSSAAQLIENLNVLSAALSVSVLFMAYHAAAIFGLLLTALLIIGLMSACFMPVFKVPKTAIKISGSEWVQLFVLPLIAWLLAGTAFYLIVLASGQPVEFVSAVAANAAAVGLGILAIFAPGGIGVREFIYDKFGINGTGIVAWRLLTLVLDVIVGLSAIYWINRSYKNRD